MDWTTISSLATAAGTLVLGVATFASVRSANPTTTAVEAAAAAAAIERSSAQSDARAACGTSERS